MTVTWLQSYVPCKFQKVNKPRINGKRYWTELLDSQRRFKQSNAQRFKWCKFKLANI